MTGFNLPPGCTTQMIDDAFGVEEPCAVCRRAIDDCICPVCPHCNTQGEPRCYVELNKTDKPCGLTLSTPQLIARTQYEIANLRDQIADHETYIQWLEEEDNRK